MEAHHHAAPSDQVGKLIGLQTAVIAILLSIVTILSHRAHTDAIIFGNESSNTWAQYQAKRIRSFQTEMNISMIKLVAVNNPQTPATITALEHQVEKYKEELEEIKKEAQLKADEQKHVHHQASFFDLAEGILEVSMILSSLYFLTQRRLFPNLGLAMAVVGSAIAIIGLLIINV